MPTFGRRKTVIADSFAESGIRQKPYREKCEGIFKNCGVTRITMGVMLLKKWTNIPLILCPDICLAIRVSPKKKIAEKVKAVFFFDMDETVLDSGKVYLDVGDTFAEELTRFVEAEDLNEEKKKFWDFYGKTYLKARERGNHARLYKTMKMYAESRGVNVNKSEELSRIGKEVYRKKIPLKPHAEEVIRSLNKDKCAVFLYTEGNINKMAKEQRNLFRETYVISPKTVSKMKSTFSKALDKVNVKDENIYLVGDDPDTDIKIGNELGFTTIRFLSDVFVYTEAKNEVKPDFTIKDLGELPSIVSY